jgi:DNA-binding HxlR family transcriptional regulator
MSTVMDRITVGYRPDHCSIARSLQLLGERWTLLVLRAAFSGVRRFDDIQQDTGAPRQVLSVRLAQLVEHDILRRVPYQEPGQRQRHEYRLTQKGLDLYPVLVGLLHWGDRYLTGDRGPSVLLTHRHCGAPVQVALRCSDGHDVGTARDVRAVPTDRAATVG